jgi:predicted membrane protein
MQMRGLYGALAAMVLTIILAGAVIVYANRTAADSREKSRDDVVIFACLAIKYSDEADIRKAFLTALGSIGHSCPPP